MTNFAPLLAKYPPKHGERTAKAIKRNAITALPELVGGTTDWSKQANLPTGSANQTLSDPIPVRGITQVKKKKPGKGK